MKVSQIQIFLSNKHIISYKIQIFLTMQKRKSR